ncbi:enoyl-CoA hydratase/isomerase family protein [Aquihabitans sp. McL0605]|uniref:enoyl-CoA hydratase/isomerase family protein n=1 Tax=Aquihabitans sp. McL0605 TaxID=3415671 RepID=UPI003CF7EA1B
MTRPLPTHHPKIRVEVDGHVVTVTLDNEAAKNACDGDMWVAIGATFRDIAFSGARAVVLTGANGAFCAGADLSGLAGGGGGGGGTTDDGAPPETMVAAMRVLAGSVLAIHECPVPVIAKVDGLCVGAGLGLALAADLLWCSDRARFSAIFAKRGLSLDFGSSWLLRQRLPVHVAKELCFTGRMVPADEALSIGLVNAVVPADGLDAAVAELVATVAGGPPVALSMTKRQLDGAPSSSLAQALEVEALAQSVNVRTEDLREALIAYVERRPPTFHGR